MYIYIHSIKKFPDVFRRNYTFWTCIFNWTCPSLRRSIIAWPIHYAFEHQRAEQRDIFWISNCKLSHNFSGTNGSLIRKKKMPPTKFCFLQRPGPTCTCFHHRPNLSWLPTLPLESILNPAPLVSWVALALASLSSCSSTPSTLSLSVSWATSLEYVHQRLSKILFRDTDR